MTTTISKKDFKIIGINPKNSQKIIIEINRITLDKMISRKIAKRKKEENIIESISGSEDFIGTEMHKKGLEILSKI